ncbi:MAG: NAD-dependent deacylase [Alphaproteobacteria bacterium]|jgi:NAD-dependent deacetylase|nr:NAD-dependent deacylase [Alphaproteobacteria bacterium]
MTQHRPKIVVLTGAGISAESGVPVFRGPDGLWHGRRVEDVATHEAVTRDPWGVNAFFNELRRFVKEVKPNPAHLALKRLEDHFQDNFLLVTQNIDPLHKQAGSQRLRPMHGELESILCEACGHASPFFGEATQDTTCPHCTVRGSLRPDIVLFNEMPYYMDEIYAALSRCNVFVAVGTSGFVYPAAGFVDIANRAGARTIEVNLADTMRSPSFEEKRTGPAGTVLPVLVDEFISTFD